MIPFSPVKEDPVKTRRRPMLFGPVVIIVALFVLSAFSALGSRALAADDEIALKTKITAVTVYGDRAQVTRSGRIDLKTGTFKIVCDDLPQGFDEASLQLEGKGTAAANILGVDVVRVQGQLADSPRYKELQSRLEKLTARRDSIQIEIGSVSGSIEFLSDYAKYPFTEKEAKAAPDAFRTQDFKTLMDYIASERAKTNLKLDALNKTVKKVDEEIDWVNGQLAEMKTKDDWTKRVVIDCEAASPGDLRLDLAYNVTGATWGPEYTVRFDEAGGKLTLDYNGRIEQHTGEDWKSVAMQLSTAQPQLGAAPPELTPLYITRRPRPIEYGAAASVALKTGIVKTGDELHVRGGRSSAGVAPSAPPELELVQEGVNIASSAFAATFSVPKPVDLPTGAEPRRVLILERELRGAISRYSAPRLSQNVFVKDEIKNALDAPLLGGTAEVYVQAVPAGGGRPTSNFVGREPVKPTPSGQEFALHVGIDQDMKATFKLEKREYLTKEGAAVKKIRYHYLLTLENFKPAPTAVTVQDRIPVSTVKDVRVTDVDLSPDPSEKRDDGILTWNLTPGSKERKEIRIAYTVEMPGDWPEREINLE
jgi:uncharacterized protein (TIGR02231 family)